MDTIEVGGHEEEWKEEDTNWIFFSPFLIAQHVYNSLFINSGEIPDINAVGWNVRRHHGVIIERDKLEKWMEQFKLLN